MIDDRRLNKEYKELQQQNTPDLWDRIESGLQPVDRSEASSQTVPKDQTAPKDQAAAKEHAGQTRRKRPRYGWVSAAAAAAVLGIVVIGGRMENTGHHTSDSPSGTMAETGNETAEPETIGLAAESSEPSDNSPGTDMEMNHPGENMAETSHITLTRVNSLKIPDHARTVPYDAEYFSEDILRETDLLCDAVITDVSFAYDDSGDAVHVIYHMTVNDVYYAENYVAGMDELSVSSPIIETEGDEAYLLFQMQVGGHYLLPLRDSESGWELLYPFAPQIQVLEDRGYVFHTGYQSLLTGQVKAVEGSPQGENDFYFDRMVIREDSSFLSDLAALMK